MKKIAIGFAVLCFFTLLLFFSQRMMWLPWSYVPNNRVKVDFFNQSSQLIKSIQLNYTSGKKEVGPLEINQSTTTTFEHSGEGTFQFTVIFDSGKKLQDATGYVEGGYHLKKYILDNEINTVF